MATVPQAWAVLELALVERRVVRLRYHGHGRVVCPHVLGWKSGRAMCLCYQVGGTTSEGTLPAGPRERWRSMFVDQVEEAVLTGDAWQSGENYSPSRSNCVDVAVVAVGSDEGVVRGAGELTKTC